MVSLRTLIVGLSALGVALAQDTTSASDLLTIQTSPPTPTGTLTTSGISSSVTSLSTSTGTSSGTSTSISGIGTSTSTSAGQAATTTAPTIPNVTFPQACAGECSAISNALSTCGSGLLLDTSCLCSTSLEQSYRSCLECALGLNPTTTQQASYQQLINSYITTCASDQFNPVTLPPVTITLPNPTALGTSSSTSLLTLDPAVSSTTRRFNTGSDIIYPTSAVSHPPLSSSTRPATSATVSSTARSSGSASSSGAGQKMERGNALMGIGLAGVLGAVVGVALVG
ncbi:hypothetical protein CI109_106750 [Kwoniella shandongensis]|uniref:Uncharacterized protein n=1 Tax=Kwoniella shandongensis TaxID=1734106 RepID=A0A5M6C707_9TREE|nr:uncharacterized protein CI109_000993 [Kwoniella shandongensis]KAA5530813.1 hypothetical protein CI109_000993 [Kwoniella shandongensis]